MDVLLESSKLDNLYLEIYEEFKNKKHMSNASDQVQSAKLSKKEIGDANPNFWDDPIGKPELTKKQKSRFDKWIRLTQITGDSILISNDSWYNNIQQGCVGNCSFLSSLISMANYDSAYNRGVIDAIFVQDPSEDEGFSCRIYINGASRKIKVDDWVPIREDGRLLSAHSTNKNEIWVTLVEKVFIKLLGNTYNVTGTNPCIDIYRFTGFIPEIIALDHEKQDFIWNDLYYRFNNGLCMSCLGTLSFDNVESANVDYELANAVNSVSSDSGLISNHAYSIINVRSVNGHKLLFLKNPWNKISWKQRFSDHDTSDMAKEVFKLLDYQVKTVDNGVFWIDWPDVVKWFSYLYVSHDPNQFNFGQTIHLRWNLLPHLKESLLSNSYFIPFNPQIKVKFKQETSVESVWVLFIQHIKSNKHELKYIATHVYFKEKKVFYNNDPDIYGVFYNYECALNKLNNVPPTLYLTFNLLELPSEPTFNFTLKVFANDEFEVEPIPTIADKYKNHLSITSEWNDRSVGVNDFENFFNNPKVKFSLNYHSRILLILESCEPLYINLKVFKGIEDLDFLLRSGRVVSSGSCRLHMCCIEDEFPVDTFVIVPSAYSGGYGEFRIIAYISPIGYTNRDVDTSELGTMEML